MARRLLAFAVASGRASYVYFIGKEPVEWKISDRATQSVDRIKVWAEEVITFLRPDVVVTEKPDGVRHKGDKTKQLVEAIAEVASNHELLDVSVTRAQTFANKYAEAEALGARFPELLPWVPKRRRFFDNEPRATVLFEAVALALVILAGPDPVPGY